MRLEVLSPGGVGEVVAGDDLADLLMDTLTEAQETLFDGDVVVVTSKVVSKAEGRVAPGDREAGVASETVRVVARRGATRIVRTRHGLTMAAAGVDASNVPVGQVALLPVDPDASARALRRRLAVEAGVNVAVVVADTAGRAWREGQTDIAIGAAGLVVLDDHAGRTDAYGNPLAVTAPAVADELAGAAELAGGKLAARPFAVVRGRLDLVLPADDDGPGARALVRPETADMFGYGAREAVLRALAPGGDDARAPFGAPAPAPELADALRRVGLALDGAPPEDAAELVVGLGDDAGPARVRLDAVATAYGWDVGARVGEPSGPTVRLRLHPRTP